MFPVFIFVFSINNFNRISAYTTSEMDYLSFTTLVYGTGGPNNYQFTVENDSVKRRDPSKDDTTDFDYSQQALIYTDEVTHSGTDVLIYARGEVVYSSKTEVFIFKTMLI